MAKVRTTIRINKELDSKFRSATEAQGKFYSATMEEAIKLWLKNQRTKK